MSAHLHLHSAKDLADGDLECFTHSWEHCRRYPECAHWDRVEESSSVEIGEVSWAKAAFMSDEHAYVPEPVAAVEELFHPVRPRHPARAGAELRDRTRL